MTSPLPEAEVVGSRLPEAVLFDMDGTLFDSEKLWDVGLDDLARHLGGSLSHSARVTMIGAPLALSMEILHADLGRPDLDVESSGAWLEDRMRELFLTALVWRPGARELLAAVRAARVPTALVTATRRNLVEVALDTLGRENFDAVVCGDEVAHSKPHPEPYLRAAALLGVNPGDCVAVEDSVNGTASAEAAGCPVLVVPSEAPVPAGPRRVHRESLAGVGLPELAAVLRAVA
ncbi:HAD family hydrolase [Cryptosporangium aurantiacum]|uniref:Haloacid dehalogenase superfamily, subfamily IA, variant 3 with third motif having DD or ED n=1 Tax=Cryptosporangium aurantiacum TaxID=134849 RepID=A0A1M7RI80_9ACTN|nr:HAD family phosphatase [Cryptosporangium aurantiacum]SHN45920.1 haloacid dehalogenase superfamily, subfamily IA, variant 3 with third motif having DD or ED [Cryptosporangium aurantiacum]